MKSIAWILKDDIQDAAGPLQTAIGLPEGAETIQDKNIYLITAGNFKV